MQMHYNATDCFFFAHMSSYSGLICTILTVPCQSYILWWCFRMTRSWRSWVTECRTLGHDTMFSTSSRSALGSEYKLDWYMLPLLDPGGRSSMLSTPTPSWSLHYCGNSHTWAVSIGLKANQFKDRRPMWSFPVMLSMCHHQLCQDVFPLSILFFFQWCFCTVRCQI
jgi:hypothetical protein